MAIHIDQLTTEVLAEPEPQLAGAAAAPASDRMTEQAGLRFELAEAIRLEQRTRAEAYDD